jgi:hypothetical protein
MRNKSKNKGNFSKTTKPPEEEIHFIISKKAYELYQSRGLTHGRDLEDWFEAERVILEKYKSKIDTSPKAELRRGRPAPAGRPRKQSGNPQQSNVNND